ncbi:unnamed protein product [Adineta ricciae]|uniref:Uncharacterized protein n=1 Tax=Adineta ricciae TaxID=249248 RepID=A0A815VLK0_ADIRI|nr:unnamed protein product [Adineta ricciae]CAF1534481.1 unnamed protein product [Adineta ricciae]
MSFDSDTQQVALAITDEHATPLPRQVRRRRKRQSERRNYCTEDYIVRYGVPVLIVILLIVLFVLAFLAIRRYNRRCQPNKESTCRGLIWFFT